VICEKLRLDDNDEEAFLEVYAAEEPKGFVRRGILIIPGGGYHNVCSDREGEPIAQAFIPYGYNAFVLHYSVGNAAFPRQLIQASKAMKLIKDNSEKYRIDPEQVFTVGFSAGGHLAASLGTLWHIPEVYKEIDMPYGYNKPRGMMLIYPVISAYYHEKSFKNLFCGSMPTEEQKKLVSIEKRVDERTCPAYIMHTSNDNVVNIKS